MTTNTSAYAASALALQRLILDEDLEHLEDLLAEFNLFDVLKIERRELQHSALLAWLLDPSASHGLQDYFLRRFLTAAAAKAQDDGITGITPLHVDAWELVLVQISIVSCISEGLPNATLTARSSGVEVWQTWPWSNTQYG